MRNFCNGVSFDIAIFPVSSLNFGLDVLGGVFSSRSFAFVLTFLLSICFPVRLLVLNSIFV